MNVCFTGINPYQPKGAIAEVHVIPQAGDVLCVGTRCADGRPIRESWKYKEAIRLGCRILRPRPIFPSIVSEEERGGDEEEEQGDEKHNPHTAEEGPLADRWKPTSLAAVIGHRAEIAELRAWLAGWSSGSGSRAVLIYGPPGIGKTTVAHLLAKEAGYTVTEYNASDARSIARLKGIFALGMKRLGKELIVMDEVDGLSERGGVGELASIVKRTLSPMICIANELGTKLTPLKSACHVIGCSRPMRGTIATALLGVCAAEGIRGVTKAMLEGMCEKNGNDIRGILNQLDFYRKDVAAAACNKDNSHSMTSFRAAGSLLSCGDGLSWETAADYVFYDPFLVPLMVQEAYLSVHGSGGAKAEDTAAAADWISRGDGMNRRLLQTQDWSLLPQVVATTVGAARTLRNTRGRVPAQIFPQVLGKMSKRAKHVRWLEEMGRRIGAGGGAGRVRMEYLDTLRMRAHGAVATMTPKHAVGAVQELGLTREDVLEVMTEIGIGVAATDLPTKVKSAFTREWNKAAGVGAKRKAATVEVIGSDEEEDDVELAEALEELGLE